MNRPGSLLIVILVSLGLSMQGGWQTQAAPAAAVPASGGQQTTHPVITAENVAQLHVVGHMGLGGTGHVIWAGDDQHLVITSGTGIWQYDLTNGFKNPQLLGNLGGKFDIVASADGHIIAWPHDWVGTVWNSDKNSPVAEISLENRPDQDFMRAIAVSEDGSITLFADDFNSFFFVDTRTRHDFTVNDRTDWPLALAPDGSLVVTNHWERGLLVSRIASDALTPIPSGLPRSGVATARFSHDGKFLAAGYNDGDLWIEAVGDSPRLMHLKGKSNGIKDIVFTADNNGLAVLRNDGAAEVWDLHSQQLVFSARRQQPYLSSIAVSKDGIMLLSSDYDGSELWNVTTGKQIAQLKEAENMVFSPSAKVIAGIWHRGVAVWEAETGKLVSAEAASDGGESWGSSIVSPDSKTVLSIDPYDGTVRVHDLITGELINSLKMATGLTTTVIYGHDDNTVIMASADGMVRILDLARKVVIRTLVTRSHINSLELSKDGSKLVAGGPGGLFVWDAASGDRLWVASGDYSMASFSGDGKRLAALTQQGKGQIWDMANHVILSSMDVYVPKVYKSKVYESKADEYFIAYVEPGIAYFRFLPDGKTIVYSARRDTLQFRDSTALVDYPKNAACIDGDLIDVTFNPVNDLLILSCLDSHYNTSGQVFRTTPEGAEVVYHPEYPDSPLYVSVGFRDREYFGNVQFTPDGKILLVNDTWIMAVH